MSANGRGDIWIYRNNFMLSIRNPPIVYNKEEESGFLNHFYSDWKSVEYLSKVK